jgi:hypothetical protein
LTSGLGGSPCQIESNALPKSSPLIVPLVAPFTLTCTPAPGLNVYMIRRPDFMSAIHPLSLAMRSFKAGNWPFAFLSKASSQPFALGR